MWSPDCSLWTRVKACMTLQVTFNIWCMKGLPSVIIPHLTSYRLWWWWHWPYCLQVKTSHLLLPAIFSELLEAIRVLLTQTSAMDILVADTDQKQCVTYHSSLVYIALALLGVPLLGCTTGQWCTVPISWITLWKSVLGTLVVNTKCVCQDQSSWSHDWLPARVEAPVGYHWPGQWSSPSTPLGVKDIIVLTDNDSSRCHTTFFWSHGWWNQTLSLHHP